MTGPGWADSAPPQSVGFAAVPTWMIRDTAMISKHAMLAYLALSHRINEFGEAFPSIATIAREARCSRTSAKDALNELEAIGVISRRRTQREDGGFGHNVYRVHVGMRAGQDAYRALVSPQPTPGQPATDTRSAGGYEVEPVEVEGYALFEHVEPSSKKDLDRTPSGISRFDREEVSDDLPATPGQVEYLIRMHKTCGILYDGAAEEFAALSRAAISGQISDMQGMYRADLRKEAAA